MNYLFLSNLFYKFSSFEENNFILSSVKKQYIEAIEKLKDPSTELTFVPNIISFFESIGVPQKETKKKLLQLSNNEIIELRPESGLGRLTEEEKEKCIKIKLSTDEYFLSWIRLLSNN